MHAEAHAGRVRGTPAWAFARRWLGRAFVLLVVVLLVRLAGQVDWAEAWGALQRLPAGTLGAAAGLCALSHGFYACYDLIGRQQTHHGLPVPRTMAVSFMSYAFNLNLGALVGGVAFRFKVYSKLGLPHATTARVWLLSLLTNWLGYFTLAGFVLILAPPALPPSWGVAPSALPAFGGALLLAAAGYVAACFGSHGRSLRFGRHAVRLPSGQVALLQLLLATTSWAVIATICWVLLQERVAYPLVLGALLTAAVAGVIAHVPAGLGVLEAVFVLLLSNHVAQGELLGALLAYRALYYLSPLLAATALFAWFHLAMKKGGRSRPS